MSTHTILVVKKEDSGWVAQEEWLYKLGYEHKGKRFWSKDLARHLRTKKAFTHWLKDCGYEVRDAGKRDTRYDRGIDQ